MNPLMDGAEGALGPELEQQLLSDLEKQSLQQIQKLRKHQRFEVRVPVVLQHGSSSARREPMVGTSVDLSDGGCMLQFPRPVGVGDIFQLTFEDGRLDLPVVFARCRRCAMIREDLFEAGFSFFSPISLHDAVAEDGLLD